MTTPTAALAELVERHNTSDSNIIKRLADQQRTIDELRRQLKAARAENAELRLKADSLSLFTERGAGGEVNPRPAVTIRQYLQNSGLTYMQVYRRLRGEVRGAKLEGYQDPSGQWWVYTA